MKTASAVTIYRGFWCEYWVESPTAGDEPVLVASLRATTPSQAVRWIRLTLRIIVPALEGAAAERAWTWLDTGYKGDVDALIHNRACAVSANYAATRVSWTVRPALFLPMAHPSINEVPPCSARLRLTE